MIILLSVAFGLSVHGNIQQEKTKFFAFSITALIIESTGYAVSFRLDIVNIEAAAVLERV